MPKQSFGMTKILIWVGEMAKLEVQNAKLSPATANLR